MTDVGHQTVRLSPGRQRRPDDGACVMELASMLAGEPSSDRPQSVCPVIAPFPRSYDDERRRDFLRFASEAVGTRDQALHELHSLICREWIAHRHRALARRPFRLLPAGVTTVGAGLGDPPIGATADHMAARLARRYGHAAHDDALELADRRIGCSRPQWGNAPRRAELPLVAAPEP